MYSTHPGAIMAGGGAAAGFDALRNANAPPKAVNPSCFGNVESVREVCESAAGRVERAVAKLCGDPPPSPGADGPLPSAHGLFGIADLHARDIRESMKRIFDAIERLESQLP